MSDTVEFNIGGKVNSSLTQDMKAVLKAQDDIIKSLQKEVAESKKAENQSIAFYRKAAGEAERMHQREVAGLQKKAQEQEKATAKLREGSQEQTKAAVAVGQFVKVAGGLVTVGSIIGGIKAAFAEMNAEAERSQQVIDSFAQSAGALAQVARSPEDFAKMRAEAELIAVREGMTPTAANELMFSAVSAGKRDQAGFYAGLNQITDPKALLESVKTVQSAFGTGEAGTDEQLVNKFFAAAKLSKSPVQTLVPAATVAAQAMKPLGGTDEELLGAISVTGEALKSPEMAATQMRAFANLADKTAMEQGKKITGGLGGAYEFFEKMSSSARNKLLGGNTEAKAFYQMFGDNREAIAAAQASIAQAQAQAGTAASPVGQAQQAVGADVRLAGNKARHAAEMARQHSALGGGTELDIAQAAADLYQATRRAGGRPELVLAVERMTSNAMLEMGVRNPENFLMDTEGRIQKRVEREQAAGGVSQETQALVAAMKELKDAIQAQRGGGAARPIVVRQGANAMGAE